MRTNATVGNVLFTNSPKQFCRMGLDRFYWDYIDILHEEQLEKGCLYRAHSYPD